MHKLCVAGSSGMLGQAFVRYAERHGWETLGISRRATSAATQHICADIFSLEHYRDELLAFGPDCIVNAIALVDLAGCEREPDLAEAINAQVPALLARLSVTCGARMIQISTDNLFNGRGAPYDEEREPTPMNRYGTSKFAGERSTLEENRETLVIRTNIVGRRYDESRPTFAEWLDNALRKREEVTLYTDYLTSPIHVDDLVAIAMEGSDRKVSGILNVAARNGMSKYEFGMSYATAMGYSTHGITAGTMPRDAVPRRAHDLRLDCSRAERLFQRELPDCQASLVRLCEDFQ